MMGIRLLTIVTVLILLSAVGIAPAFAREPSHGIAYFGDLKYPKDFPHYDYVNADAPKGGKISEAVIGTFNNLHPYVSKGIPAICVNISCMLIYDTLMKWSDDELYSAYGNLAETIELADDYSWAAFTLRDSAYWHDGMPVTVEDVIWTFNTIKAEASIGWKSAYVDILSIERTGPRSFKFHFNKAAPKTPQLAMQIASFIPLPKHYWEGRTFNATTLEPPLGSGPYRIKEVDAGHKIVYERVEDYWGKDLNVNTGHYNFDLIKYIYFLDRNVVVQAHKSHTFDYRIEYDSKDWTTAYDFEGYRRGLFKKSIRKLKIPHGMRWGILFNSRDAKLSDIRVREALILAFDWEWENRVLFHGANKRNNSYFLGSAMETTGLPSANELELLAPYRDELPERVFTEPFNLPIGSGYGRHRDALLRANELLEESGWIIKDFKRINKHTGEPFFLDMLAKYPGEDRLMLPFADSLKRLGIASRIRMIEISQATNRMRNYDFEATLWGYWQNDIPSANTMRSRFSSSNADRLDMTNYAGIKIPAVDALTETIIAADSMEKLSAAGRALDRILLWNFYIIPGGYPAGFRTVYWDRFGYPSEDAGMKGTGYHHLWWFDAVKSARVDAGIVELEK
ncbi:MAG: extracellular solute-binding protein [Desulfobacterales bacterium]